MRGFFFWSIRMAKLSPVFNWAEFINGIPATGGKVFAYAAGSSTKQNTYTDEGGLTANPNPIILDARGEPPNDIWLTEGQSYKFVFTSSTDTDPPTSPIRTIDDVTGVNDTGTTTSQWVDSGVTPTYVNATQFTLPGDQTTEFQVNRRIKATVTAGTVYGYISASVFGALTTVTVVLDSGTLDSGLSAVQLGLITPTNTSLFKMQTGNYEDASITQPKLAASLREILAAIQDFRLTLTTGVPVTTSDVTGATTIYCAPYKGNSIALFDGTNWNVRTSNQFSLALGTLTSGVPYDVFCYDNAGTPTLEFTAWTNDTTRATALTYQDGVLSKTGALTRRYLGTFYTTATTTTEDSASKRFLWNYYHRVHRNLRVIEATASWTYSIATTRQVRANAANQVEYVCGVSEDACEFTALISATTSGVSYRSFNTGIGIDSTSVNSSIFTFTSVTTGSTIPNIATYRGMMLSGRRYVAWLEQGAGTDTQTFFGTESLGRGISGLTGNIYS
jgi:hypothetical protein